MAVSIRGLPLFLREPDIRLCSDCVAVMNRTPRSVLMKRLPGSRLYVCEVCGTRLFETLGLSFKFGKATAAGEPAGTVVAACNKEQP